MLVKYNVPGTLHGVFTDEDAHLFLNYLFLKGVRMSKYVNFSGTMDN